MNKKIVDALEFQKLLKVEEGVLRIIDDTKNPQYVGKDGSILEYHRLKSPSGTKYIGATTEEINYRV